MHAAHSFMMFRVPLERAAAFMFLPVTVLIISSIHIYLAQCQLVVLSEYTCPGRELRLKCTVVGSGNTLWKGTAFDCNIPNNEIILPHTQRFGQGDVGICNNGMIVGHGLNRTFDGLNSMFTSQLVIHLPLLNATNSSLDGRNIECIYDNAPPPDNVHLAQVSKNALTFQWEPGICPNSTGYKVNATNCGMCPNTTLSTSLTCVVSGVFTASIKTAFCSLSIETVACGINTGNRSSTVAALLKAPDPPNISRVVPYYSARSKELVRIDVDLKSDQIEKFNISEGIDGSINTYTFNIRFLDSDLDCSTSSLATVPVSSCVDHICKITLDLANLTSLPCYTPLSRAEMAVYASNVLTDGQPSTTLLNTSNSVFFVEFEPLSHTFSCRFIGHYGIKSCEITIYGATDPTDEICSLKDQVTKMNSSDDFVLDTVTVPVHIAQNDHESMRLCFRAVGTTAMFTVGVEGTFTTTGILPKSNMNPTLILAVSLLCITIILILLASIAILLVVLIRKCYHQSEHEQQLSQPQQQPITDHQMIYSEVNPLNINGNNTLFMLEDDDKVEYAELNHQLHCHTSNPTKTCAAESINFEATDDSLTVTLDSLLIQLRSQITSVWYKFGLALGISKDTLDRYVGYPDEECIVEVLDYWMRNHNSKPTWRDVAKSLKDVGLHQLADGILNVYKTGKLPIEVDMEAIPQGLLESELDIESQSTLDSPPPLPPKYY